MIGEFTKRYPQGAAVDPAGQPLADRGHDPARPGRHRYRHRGHARGTRAWCRCPATSGRIRSSRRPTIPCWKKHIALEDIASYPLITYDPNFAGRPKIDKAFALRQLEPDIILEAIDADVIKTYGRDRPGHRYRGRCGVRCRARPQPARHPGRPPVRHQCDRIWPSNRARICAASSIPSSNCSRPP